MSTDTESRIEGDGYYALWRRNDLAVINGELAQRVVDRARLFEDGLLDLFRQSLRSLICDGGNLRVKASAYTINAA